MNDEQRIAERADMLTRQQAARQEAARQRDLASRASRAREASEKAYQMKGSASGSSRIVDSMTKQEYKKDFGSR